MTSLSLSEVEALAKKATRGAGYPWGIAEEAGRAMRWLCAADIDGCRALSDLLIECDGVDLSDRAPRPGNAWRSRSDRLCPLLTGAALSDRCDMVSDVGLLLENVARPILLAPFGGLSAKGLEAVVCLEWDDVYLVTDGENAVISGDVKTASATVSIKLSARLDLEKTQSRCSRANPDEETIATLNRFAFRTYAPATEASRLSGAGAGLSDND